MAKVQEEPICTGKTMRKVLITAFPLRYPEQIRSGEYMSWAQTTGEEMARLLSRSGRMRVAAQPESFPFADPNMAPALERNEKGIPLITTWAKQAQAHYVLTGVFQDFGTAEKWLVVPERQMTIEVFLFDGNSGALLERREFARQVLLDGSLPRNIAPGTREFAASRFGKAYNELLLDIGRWAENIIACQPFALKITRVEDRRLHLDAGSNSGIAVGMELATSPAPQSTPTNTGSTSTGLRLPTAVIKEVTAAASIAEIPQQRNPPKFQAGNVLYVIDK